MSGWMQVISELIVNIFSWCRNNIGDTAAILSVLLVVWELRKTKLNNYLLNMDLLRQEEPQVIGIDDFWINLGYLQRKYQKERRIRRYIGKRTGYGAKKKQSYTKE